MSYIAGTIKHAHEQIILFHTCRYVNCHSHNISPHAQIQQQRVVQAAASIGRGKAASAQISRIPPEEEFMG